jgi:hypothetical protein
MHKDEMRLDVTYVTNHLTRTYVLFEVKDADVYHLLHPLAVLNHLQFPCALHHNLMMRVCRMCNHHAVIHMYIINHSQIACETRLGMTVRLACDCVDKIETGWAFRCCTALSIESYIAVSLHPMDRKQTIKTKTETQHKLYQITCTYSTSQNIYCTISCFTSCSTHTADATSRSMTPTLLQAHRKSALDGAKAVLSKKK